MEKRVRVSVLGAGSWGITLATLLYKKGYGVKLWEVEPERAELLRSMRRAEEFLPGIVIEEGIEITSDLREVLEFTPLIFATPTQVVREVARKIKNIKPEIDFVVSGVKGLEQKTNKRVSEILKEELKIEKLVVISGPSIAYEVIKGTPTSVVASSEDGEVSKLVQRIFFTQNLRVYTSEDMVGVELGGALKNVIVIASGICDGLGLGANAKGALLTRGLAEITRMGKAMGADPLTFAGLSGIGDLITTAFSKYSRNRYVGEEIGKGRSLNSILSSMVMIAEGIPTSKSVKALSERYDIEMPISQTVYQILFEGLPPKEGVKRLMERELKPEIW